jgi:hypothetical protein
LALLIEVKAAIRQRGFGYTCPTRAPGTERGTIMVIVLLALLVLILFGAGFAVHLLWIAAVVLAVVWVASFALSRGEGASRRSLRR